MPPTGGETEVVDVGCTRFGFVPNEDDSCLSLW